MALGVVRALATLCVHGFADDAPIAVEVDRPTGERTSFDVLLDGTYQEATADPLDGAKLHGVWTAEDYDRWHVRWVLPSTSSVGTYHITATQHDVVSDAAMSVVEPSEPHLAMVDPPECEGLVAADRPQWAALGFQPGGIVVQVPLAGYEPGPSYCLAHALDEAPGGSCLNGFTFEG